MLDGVLLEFGGRLVLGHGAADGLDDMAEEWAASRGVPSFSLVPDWARLGRKAGRERNSGLLRELLPDVAVVFPGGSGTDDMLAKARQSVPDVRVVSEFRPDYAEVGLADL